MCPIGCAFRAEPRNPSCDAEGLHEKDANFSSEILEEHGANLRYPHSSGIKGSKHSHMRELRIQHGGEPYRVLYAFDPRRAAILLIGGNKTGDKDWYEKYVPLADRLYDEHLAILHQEKANLH